MSADSVPARLLLTSLLVILVALGCQGSRALWIKDEQRYTNIAMQMLRSGDWVHPRLDAENYHYAKPPMTYWAIAASVGMFGRSEWAARLPNALAFMLTALLAGLIAERLSPGWGYGAALIYSGTLMPCVAMNIITTDTLLALFETLAVYGFVRWWWTASRRRADLWLMWLAFGLAFLTKGPPALLPLLSIGAFAWIYDGPRTAARLFDPIGLLLFLAAGFSWFLAVVIGNMDLLRHFVGMEVVDRIFSGVHHRNPGWRGIFRIYLPTLLLGTLPWTLFLLPRLLPGAERTPVRRWIREPANAFLSMWILLPLTVFLLSQSRLPFYLLPLFIPVAILLAGSLPRVLERKRAWGFAITWAAVLIFAKAASAWVPTHNDPRDLAGAILRAYRHPLQRIVMVQGDRIQGLSFYADAEVRVVTLGKTRVNFEPVSFGTRRPGLRDELARRECCAVYVVERKLAPRFVNETRESGFRTYLIGHYGTRLFYSLRDLHERRPGPKPPGN